MTKLEDALNEAKGDNVAESAYDKAKDVGKNKAKKEGMKAAKKGGKKALGGAKSAAKSISNKGLGGALKNGAKSVARGAKMAVKGVIGFVKSGPIGWVAGGLAVILACTIAGSSGGDVGDIGSSGGLGIDDSMHIEEEAAAILGEVCPPADYGDYSADSGSLGGLEDPSSVYYQNARQTFDIWVNGGLSGAAAASIVGWTMGEGGFHMIGRAEGHYGSNDPKDASIRYGHVPRNSAFPSKDGGGGIYQFTPYTKYAPLGDEAWEDIVKMHDHMFNIMADTGPSWEEGPDWIAEMDYTGGNHSFREFAEHSDPKMTVLMWNAHERMSDKVFQKHNLKPKKEADAQMVYDLFGGADHAFDPVAFEQNFGSSSSGGVDGQGIGVNDPCVVTGGSPWGGIGGQPSITSGVFAYNLLPEELKQYALDLESLPLRYGNSMDWKWNTSTDHMQCVDLSSNLTKLLWQKNGEPIGNTKGMGNGADVVGGYVGRFGGSSSTEPSAGAIFSTPMGSAMCGTSKCGHTGVVSHVFDNGDILVIEENWGTYSGTGVGPNTYNYRYIQRGALSKNSYTFYDPSTSGHTLTEGLKSIK